MRSTGNLLGSPNGRILRLRDDPETLGQGFPGSYLENRCETLIENQEEQSRRLIDYLGLPWDDACAFLTGAAPKNTYSNWQVRQPIYTSSVKRWKNYESEIQPLIEALGDLAEV
ncbi:hypothetical protein [Mesorhizobium sp. WSM1497]|uniref:hypothetical protein n=1 Tax=Mesorhizobium sp. WSM1497 TaxID=278153 RepID=UPI0007EC870D|nr:hypothetical protein [Mesorhizobium sp. WSM1497]